MEEIYLYLHTKAICDDCVPPTSIVVLARSRPSISTLDNKHTYLYTAILERTYGYGMTMVVIYIFKVGKLDVVQNVSMCTAMQGIVLCQDIRVFYI